MSWHPPRETPEVPREYWRPGFWAVVSHADITTASHHHELYSSSLDAGGILMRAQHPAYRPAPTFILMDPPEHSRYRQVMSKAFHPEGGGPAHRPDQRAGRADRHAPGRRREFDVVRDLSARLPMLTVADLIGVPESLVEPFVRAGNNTVGAHDPDVLPPGVSPLDFVRDSIATLQQIGVDLVDHRRRHPSDDVATALAQAEFDGQPISDAELGSIMLLLSIAGNDTTKQTTSHHRALPVAAPRAAGLAGGGLRRAHRPVRRRVPAARRDGHPLRPQCGGGHRARRPAHPGRRPGGALLLLRQPRTSRCGTSPAGSTCPRPRRAHVGFGGGGVHYCLGNGIARTQLRAIFAQVLTHLPHLDVGEPVYLNSDLFNGIKRLPAVA